MSARIQVTMEDEQARKALANQEKAWKDNEEAVKKLGSTVDKNEKRQIRAAENIIKKQRTRKQVLEDNIKALRIHGQASEDGAKRSNDAIRKLIASYREEEAAIESAEMAAAEAARKSTAAYQNQQAQIKKGVTETNRLKEATKTLDQRYDELRVSIKAAFDAGEISAKEYKAAIKQVDAEQKNAKKSDPFSGGTAKFGQYVAGVASVSAAIALVKKAFADYRAEVEKGVGETDRLEGARTSLVQVSDETNFQDRLGRADAAASKFGVGRDESLAALFDAISNDAEKDFEVIVKADRVIPAEIGAKFVGEFRKVFGKENLTAQQALNTGLAAAGTSKFNVQEIQPQIRTAAQGKAALPGVESSDIAAFVSVLGTKFGERTGTAVRGLGSNLGAALIKEQEALKTAEPEEVEGIQKNINLLSKSLPEIVQGLDSEEFAGLRKDIIGGNKELLTTFEVAASSLEDIKKADAKIESEAAKSGTDESLLNRKLATFFSDPVLAAGVEKKRSEIDRDISAENALSEKGNARIVETNELNTQLNNEGAGPLGRVGATTGLAISQGLDTVRDELRESRPLTKALESVFGEFTAESKRQTEEAKRQTDAIKANKPAPAAEAID